MLNKIGQALLAVLAVAVVARVVYGLLGPLLPSLVVLVVVGSLLAFIIRGPRAGGSGFHK